ncbi:MAG: RNA polymerase sigma factor [Lysobacterales bacterium]
MPTYINDRKRARELLAGDEDDFKRFFEDYFPRLYRFAVERLSGDRQATQEVVQSTLSRTLLNLHKYRGESALFTWMCSICKNEIYDYLKARSRYKQTVILESELPDKDFILQSQDATSPDQPEDIYQRDQTTRLIHKVLDNLPPDYGNVIEWKYIDGLSLKQIAKRLNMSHAATQSILFRARLAFQKHHGEIA